MDENNTQNTQQSTQQSTQNQQGQTYYTKPQVPGEGEATTCLILGIVGTLLLFTVIGSIVSLILGIIGMVMNSKASAAGFNGNTKSIGFALSLISLIGGGIVFLLGILAIISFIGFAALY